MIYKNIMCYALLLALSTVLIELQALTCPAAGQQVQIAGLSQSDLDFYKKECKLQPNASKGILVPFITMKSSQRFGTYTAGINAPSSYESDTSSESNT